MKHTLEARVKISRGLRRAYQIGTRKRNWSTEDIRILKDMYSTTPNRELSFLLGKSTQRIRAMAFILGLKKSKEVIAASLSYPRVEGAIKKCKHCGKLFRVPPSLEYRKFCSIECSRLGQRTAKGRRWTEDEADFVRKNYKRMTIGEIARRLGRTKNAVALYIHYKMPDLERKTKPSRVYKCSCCGKEFRAYQSQRKGVLKFCSYKCKVAYQSDELVKTKCDNCQKEIEIPKHRFARGKRHFCSKSCMYSYYSGSNHPLWRGGGYRHDKSPSFRKVKRMVLERDGYRCQICGTGKDLSVHHIIPYRISKRDDPDNLITVCNSCHARMDMMFRLRESNGRFGDVLRDMSEVYEKLGEGWDVGG